MDVNLLMQRLERVAPPAAACPWDRSGVQVAGTLRAASKVAVALDPTPGFVDQALDWGAGLLLTHHPLTMEPRFLDRVDDHHRIVSRLLGAGAWLYAAHTSLDANPDGPVGWLANGLGLRGVQVLEPTLVERPRGFLMPLGPAERRFVDAWRGLDGVLELEERDRELLVVCREDAVAAVQASLAADVGGTAAFTPQDLALPARVLGLGLVGDLPEPLDWDAFCAALAGQVARDWWTLCGPEPPRTVRRVAYCTGSGGSLAGKAATAGADLLVTGDVKYHAALDSPLPMLDVGHFSLEEEMMRRFCALLESDPECAGAAFRFFPGSEPQQALRPGRT
jgi:dinuclear metal center YbgI/SA1388 family protein